MSKRLLSMGFTLLAVLLCVSLVVLPACAPAGEEETGEYTLTISTTAGGSVAPSTGAHSYAQGTVVNLTATAAAGYHFAFWSGGPVAVASDPITTITMEGDYSIKANFEAEEPGFVMPAIGATLADVKTAAATEGVMNFFCGGMTADAKSIVEGVKAMFGVTLTVNVIAGEASTAYTVMALDKEVGEPVRYDLMNAGDSSIISDLRPRGLMTELGTGQNEVPWQNYFGELNFTSFKVVGPPIDYYLMYVDLAGWMYDPLKIDPADLPQSFDDVLNYDGVFGWNRRYRQNADFLYCTGHDQAEAVAFMCSLYKNTNCKFMNPQDVPVQLGLGAIDFGITASKEYNAYLTRNPGASIEMWFPCDFMFTSETSWCVMNGCEHPNAAILCALWMTCNKAGQAWLDKVFGMGNGADPSKPEGAWMAEQTARGCDVVNPVEYPGWAAWSANSSSTEYKTALDNAMKGVGCP